MAHSKHSGERPLLTKNSPNLIRRFSGRGGQQRLVEALQRQQLVAGELIIARQIAAQSERHEFSAGHEFITEGSSDNDIYFILGGSVSINVNGRQVATRETGHHVGEMAMLDTTALRSATACTLSHTVVAKMSESQFTQLANRFPALWRRLALALASRLRERSKFHPPPRAQPVIFVGSSTEGLDISNRISRYLRRFPFVVKSWSDGVFECSKTTIEDLMTATKQCDFAILVLTADDVTHSRGASKASPRDNVIFEMGLFMGSLARERTFIVALKTVDLKIPSDLLGVTYLPVHKKRGQSLSKNILPILQKLRDSINKLGPV